MTSNQSLALLIGFVTIVGLSFATIEYQNIEHDESALCKDVSKLYVSIAKMRDAGVTRRDARFTISNVKGDSPNRDLIITVAQFMVMNAYDNPTISGEALAKDMNDSCLGE